MSGVSLSPVRVQAVMVPFSTVRVAVTSPPKPLAVPVRVSAAEEAAVLDELPPQAARLKHSAPERAMERIRFIMLKPHFLHAVPPGQAGTAVYNMFYYYNIE